MTDIDRLRRQVDHAESIASETEEKLQRLMEAVKQDRQNRPQLAEGAVVDEYYVQVCFS